MERCKARRLIERRIVEQVVYDLLAAGYWLAIDRSERNEAGGFLEITREDNFEELFACDEERLYAWKTKPSPDDEDQRADAFVFFVYGNDGFDVVSDYSTSLEPHLKWSSMLTDRIDEAGHHSVWMPIESKPSPKIDHRPILVLLDTENFWWSRIHTMSYAGRHSNRPVICGRFDHEIGCKPIAWMPMPEIPTEQE